MDIQEIKTRATDVIYLDDCKDRMIKNFIHGITKAETTYIEPLNPHFNWLKQDLTLFGGLPNHGKSTFVYQLALLRALKTGEKFAIFTPENNPPDYFFDDLIHMILGSSIHYGNEKVISLDSYQKWMDFINDHFFYLFPQNDLHTPEYIQDRFREAISKHGVTGCIIDPFNQLDNDWKREGRDDFYISGFLSQYKRFALTNKIYMIIVAHTKSAIKKASNGIDYETPDIYDLAGGAMWGNKCDNIIFIHRPFKVSNPESEIVKIKISKIKKQKMVGRTGEIELEYNYLMNRYRWISQTGMYQDGFMSKQEVLTNEIPF